MRRTVPAVRQGASATAGMACAASSLTIPWTSVRLEERPPLLQQLYPGLRQARLLTDLKGTLSSADCKPAGEPASLLSSLVFGCAASCLLARRSTWHVQYGQTDRSLARGRGGPALQTVLSCLVPCGQSTEQQQQQSAPNAVNSRETGEQRDILDRFGACLLLLLVYWWRVKIKS